MFVGSRRIQDNTLIAKEVFHYLQKKMSGKMFEMALKTNMSKAYDGVE